MTVSKTVSVGSSPTISVKYNKSYPQLKTVLKVLHYSYLWITQRKNTYPHVDKSKTVTSCYRLLQVFKFICNRVKPLGQ